jgi:hypothetical protein
MPAAPIPIGYGRTELPRSPDSHAQEFLTLLLDTFFKRRDSMWVTRDPRLIIGTAQITGQVPLAIPSGSWRQAIGETVYRKLSGKMVPSEPTKWDTGIEEELDRMLAPDYLGLSFGKAPEGEANAAIDLLEATAIEQIVTKGQTVNHPYDGKPFLSSDDRPIHPLKEGSGVYKNKKSIAAGYDGFHEIQQHFWGIPHPNGRGKLSLEPTLLVTNHVDYKTWNDVRTKDEVTIKVATGGGETRPAKEQNELKGKFELEKSSYLAEGETLVFASGPHAGVPYIVHFLNGIELLPNGQIRAPQAWSEKTGTPMIPKFKYFGPNDPLVQRTGKVQIKGELTFTVTPMAPWSVLFCKTG